MENEIIKLHEEIAEIKTMLMDLTVLVGAISKSKTKAVKAETELKTEEEVNVAYFPESPELEAKFREFMDYRRTEKRNSMGAQCIKRTVNTLKKFTEKESIIALDEAMRNGYTGVFPKHIVDKKKDNKSNQSVAESWGNA